MSLEPQMSPKLIDTAKWFTTDDGRAVEFEEGVWENAEFIEYVNGFPIYVKRKI